MKILLDMNISPAWIPLIEAAGYESAHWREIGAINAPDTEIMEWARQNNFAVFTHDLDFSALLFATKATSPSVIQIRIEPKNCIAYMGRLIGRSIVFLF